MTKRLMRYEFYRFAGKDEDGTRLEEFVGRTTGYSEEEAAQKLGDPQYDRVYSVPFGLP